MTKPYKHLDRPDPDAWAIWDDGLDQWVTATLIRNPRRAEPLLVDRFGRHHKVGFETRCMRLETLWEQGDQTLVPHKSEITPGDWRPQLDDDVDLNEMHGYVVRRNGR